MVFSSFSFLCIFLPVVLLFYYGSKSSWQNLILVVASILFYLWASPLVLPILIVSTLVDYFISKKLNTEAGKRWLFIGIFLNVGMLCYFKYANFLVDQTNALLSAIGQPGFKWRDVVLPAGISFFTFEKISYLIDVRRKLVKPARSFNELFLFVAFFPHLIAGPILRYHEIEGQIRSREHSQKMFFAGWTRLFIGLGKKILIADELGRSADLLFNLNQADLPANYLWLAVTLYALQLYFDFSGYSDMAIGLALMFGFTFPENFNNPYASKSITEFWKRWHISLTAWMREYLYIPLGGNRNGSLATYRNLVIVFFISGLWHGASWTFVIWGLYHGLFLVVERLFLSRLLEKIPQILSRLYFVTAVLVGWVFFRSESLQSAMAFIVRMFDFSSFALKIPDIPIVNILHNRAQVILLLATLLIVFARFIPESLKAKSASAANGLRASWALTLFVLSMMALAGNSFTPFLYFQF